MYDLIVIGAGFAGSALAIKADDLGLRVKVLDTQETYPDYFRAEKLETDQYEALVALGLTDLVRPQESPWIDRVHTFTGGKEKVNPHSRHRGLHYADTINAFREALRDRDLLAIRKVTEVIDQPDSCEVSTDDGETLRARAIAIATGMNAGFRKSLGLQTIEPQKLVSLTFGFDVAPRSAEKLPFTAFNFRPRKFIYGLHYLSFFPVGERMRANLFTCWESRSEATREFKADPLGELARFFPDLDDRIGPIRLTSEVQAFMTRYYRIDSEHLHGMVLLGDAFQSVSPATGVGLSKCLVDVQVVVDMLPQLLEDPAARLDLSKYYRDEGKLQSDDLAMGYWQWANESATSRSVTTRLKAVKHRVSPVIRKIVG